MVGMASFLYMRRAEEQAVRLVICVRDTKLHGVM